MKRALIAAIAAAVIAGSASRAHAYGMTCNEFAAAVTSGDAQLQGLAVGYVVGAIDYLAGLICFVGNSQCGCLQNLVKGNPSGVGNAVGTQVGNCITSGNGDQAAFGPVSRAARQSCPF